MKHLKLFEQFTNLNEASINDHGKENLIGKQVRFPKGKLSLAYQQWRGDYSSIGHYTEEVSPDKVFTVTKLESVYWGSRGEKQTAPLLFIKPEKGPELMLSAMDYEPIEVVHSSRD